MKRASTPETTFPNRYGGVLFKMVPGLFFFFFFFFFSVIWERYSYCIKLITVETLGEVMIMLINVENDE